MAEEMASTGMGSGVNQRAQIKMSPEEVDAFIHERRPMSMCTLNHDGSIHAVAMWYGFIGDSIVIETKGKSQKALNLARNPTTTLLFEDGDVYEDLRGVELVCEAELVDNADEIWEAGVSVFSRYYGAYDESLKPFVEVMLNKRNIYRFKVKRTVSWDHRKLGMPPTA
jgi:nitroimidazol reductase NimA-like FMN-containing flavoprotein (pyridoxamine 5'-phosphate oxidase superfamily)